MLKTVSSVANALGALNYKGTWNADTNTPTLSSGVGTQGDYYVVSVAGATDLDGITNWGVGDWAAFNGSVWQRVEGGADGNFVNLTVTGKIGVGTDTPSDEMEIRSTSPKINFTDSNDDTSGSVGYNVRALMMSADGTHRFYIGGDEKVRILETSGDVSLLGGGNLIVNSGSGIDFSATGTGTGTSTSELFADYEEGTWTPTVTPATGSFTTVTVNYATYVKVGGIVHVSARYTLTDIGTGSGSMNIAGFPYTLSSGQGNIEFVGRHVNTGDLMSGQFSGSIFSFEKYDGTSSTAASGVYTFMFTYRHA